MPCYHCAGWGWWCNGVGNIFLAHFRPLSTNWASLNATAYLSIVSDHVHPFMATMNTSSDGYFQQDNAPCNKAWIILKWFLKYDNECTVLKWPPESPDLNPIEHLCDVVEQELCAMDVYPTNLHQLQDAIPSVIAFNVDWSSGRCI